MHFKKRLKKTIILLLIILIIFSCDKNNAIERKEIEPNDNPQYAQFVDSNILIKAKLSSEDIDYYNISPTNGFIMDFSIKAESRNNINLEILDENAEKTLFKINTKDILNYNGKIEMKDLILRGYKFFFKLLCEESKNEFNYNISFNFKNEYMNKTETEINDSFESANTIDYPKQIIYGYFLKNYDSKIEIDENIKPYLKNENVIDIDFYSIENKTDIDASINIILEYKKDIDIILFDKDYNYIKKTKNKLSTDFKSEDKYYIALAFYGDKYSIDRYSLYYEFN